MIWDTMTLMRRQWNEYTYFSQSSYTYVNVLDGILSSSPIHLLELSLGATELNSVNLLSPRQNGRHFVDDILKLIFFNESFNPNFN